MNARDLAGMEMIADFSIHSLDPESLLFLDSKRKLIALLVVETMPHSKIVFSRQNFWSKNQGTIQIP